MEIRNQAEPCLICGSINHVFISGDEDAYECFCCGNKMWLDDTARLCYTIDRNCSREQADADLQAGLPVFADCNYSI